MRKTIKKIILIILLSIIYSYTLTIEAIPTSITIFEGEKLKIPTIAGININNQENQQIITASTKEGESTLRKVGVTKLKVNLLNNIPIKNVNVDVLPRTKVIPIGSLAGVKLYTSGVLVVGMSEIKGEDEKDYKPYENTGIKEGDTIIEINNTNIATTEELITEVNKSEGKDIRIKYIHEQESLECSIKPVKTGKREYKLGLWVRDSAAGVGTVTFYSQENNSFAALGHGIQDIDTDQLINISSGEFVTTKILGINKGSKGNPGRIQGTLEGQQNIGTITQNTKFGIYGKVDNISSINIDKTKELEVATRDEIKTGKAQILTTLENGKTENYEIEIEKIYKDNNYDNKSMKIKVTDKNLLEKTGGIIQGMSGSPIIQNNKFIGAVTHVLVNEPEQGYAIFGDIMLKQLYKN